MGKHIPARSFATAVSALALALGLAACAGGPGASQSAATDPAATTMLKVADETAAAGDPGTAATLYRRAHDLAPKDPVPLAKLGAMLLAMREPGAAAQAYHAAVALAPNDPELHRGLALALLSINQPEGAMVEIRAALEKRGSDVRLYSLLGVAQDMAGHHDLAQESYRKGLELAPASIGLRNNYAMSLALAGDYKGAIARFTEITGPEAPPRYRLNLAMAYALSGDDDKATSTARQVLDEPSVRNNLAYYSLLRGMDESRRTAAIMGAEMHGGVISQSEVAAAKAALSTAQIENAVPPPPQSSVSVADLPPISAPATAPVPLTRPDTSSPAKAAAEPKSFRVASAQQERTLAVRQSAPRAEAKAPDAAAAPSPQADMPQATLPEDKTAPTALLAAAPPAPAMAEAKTEPAAPPPALAAAPPPAAPPAATEPPPPAPAMTSAAPSEPTIAKADPPPAAPEPAPMQASAAPTPPAPEPAAPQASTAPAPEQHAMATPPKPAHGAKATVDRYSVQIGSWLSEATAKKVAEAFSTNGVSAAVSHFNDHDGRTWFVVRSGDFASADEANTLRQSIKAVAPADVSPVVVRVRATQPSPA